MSNLTGNWDTISTNGVTYSLDLDRGSKPTPAPQGLIATTAVQTQEGWLGQVVIDGDIVVERGPYEDSETAMVAVNELVVERVKGLFA